MNKLLNTFYRLPLEMIAPSFLVLSFVFVLIWRPYGSRRWFRWGCKGLLLLWAIVALKLTVLGRSSWNGADVILIPFHYLWEMHTTGNTELIRSTFMNAALFFPAGLLAASLMPRDWSGRRRLLWVAGLFLGTSALIELRQYIGAIGRVEVDDLIHNALGAILGALSIVCEDILCGPRREMPKSPR